MRMNVRKIRSSKALKFLGLIISSLLIATVSAATYRYMYIDGSITVSGATMIWIVGGDVPDADIDGSTAIIDLDVEQGVPMNFTEALFLMNNHATQTFNYNLTITTAVASADFQRAKMHINENSTGSWVYVDTLDLINGNDYYSSSIVAQRYLRMTFEVNATIGTGTRSFDIQVEYWEP